MAALLFALVACGTSSKVIQPPAPSNAAQAAQGDRDAEPVLRARVSGTSVHCGYSRWNVKTGTDKAAGQVVVTPAPIATIAQLGSLPQPAPIVKGQTAKYPPQVPRQPGEMRAVTVAAVITAYVIEQDNDLHLVLADSTGARMVAEIPNPLCVKVPSPWAAAVAAARSAFVAKTGYNPPPPKPGQYAPKFVNARLPVTVTGVVFFDFLHGQFGAAPNGVELHPVLGLAFP